MLRVVLNFVIASAFGYLRNRTWGCSSLATELVLSYIFKEWRVNHYYAESQSETSKPFSVFRWTCYDWTNPKRLTETKSSISTTSVLIKGFITVLGSLVTFSRSVLISFIKFPCSYLHLKIECSPILCWPAVCHLYCHDVNAMLLTVCTLLNQGFSFNKIPHICISVLRFPFFLELFCESCLHFN